MNQHPIASAVMMAAIGLAASANAADPKDRKEIVRNFLKIFETGTTAPLDLVDGTKCIQHNPHVEDGVEGLKDLFGRLLHAMHDFRSNPRGILRLSIVRAAAISIMAPLVPAFLREYPDISLELVTDDSDADIVHERIDAGIRSGELIEKDMVAVRIFDGSPSFHPNMSQNTRRSPPEDLRAHNCIA